MFFNKNCFLSLLLVCLLTYHPEIFTMEQQLGILVKINKFKVDEETIKFHAQKFKELLTKANETVTKILQENNECITPFSEKNIAELTDLLNAQKYTVKKVENNPIKILQLPAAFSQETAATFLKDWQKLIKQGKVKEERFGELNEISQDYIKLALSLLKNCSKTTHQIQASL